MPNDDSPAPQPNSQSALLPPILTHAAAYLWLWVLPIGILLVLNLQSFWLIEGNMDEAQRTTALWLGLANCINLIAGLGLYFAVRLRSKEKTNTSLLALPAIGIQIAFLWYASAVAHEMLPRSVTLWIYPESRFFYHQYAFCMLPLFWGIIQIACSHVAFLSNRIGINLLLAIGAPLLLFAVFYVFANLIPHGWFDIGPVFFAIFIISLSILMFVGVIRSLMLIFKNLGDWNPRKHLIAIGLIALAMPIGGLLLNRSIPFPVDFQAWEIYALVIVNSLLLGFSALRCVATPRLSFWLLCASFPFTLYFFVVFLPYTPLSILGCIAMGAGFLVLTPTFLFTLHLHQLIRARRIAHQGNSAGLILLGTLCFFILPGFFTVRGLMDKAALNSALDFVYTPNLTNPTIKYPGNRASLQRALANHRNYKNGIYYPLLSDYYSWLVFDNLVLPDEKIEALELRFFGAKGSTENLDPIAMPLSLWGVRNVRERNRMPSARPPSRDVQVSGQTLEIKAVDAQTSVATLTLELTHMNPGGGEYINKLSMSPGVLINGFRLHINGTPVPGRIFEKKTALWVYTMIRDTERRDPGLLVYNHPGEVELRVFPINKGSPATVEIDFLIPEGVDHLLAPATLPDPAELIPALYPTTAQLAEGPDFTYIAPFDTSHLPTVERQQYLHLIIDRSQENAFSGNRHEAVELAKKQFPGIDTQKITLANYDVLPLKEMEPVNKLPIAGGFDLDKALSHAIAQYTREPLDAAGDEIPQEPIFVVLSRAVLSELPALEKSTIWKSHVSQFQVHSLSRDGVHKELTPASHTDVPLIRVGSAIRPAHPMRSMIFPQSESAPEYYDLSSAQTWRPLEHSRHTKDSPWTRAITLWVNNHRYAASPGSSWMDLPSLVQASRQSGVMIPATSYIVVENDAQWHMLEKKEAQKLEQNEALDFLETPAPPVLILGLGFGAWLYWRKRRLIT